MRARNIKPSFFDNEVVAELEYPARLLFIGLWCLADREGRLEDRPKRIEGQLFRWDKNVEIEPWLEALRTKGFITRYMIESARYIQVRNFTKHQHPHRNEAESTIPKELRTKDTSAPVKDISTPAESVIGIRNRNPDLLIDKGSATPKTRALAERHTNPQVRQLIDAFFEAAKSKLGEKPVFNGGAAGRGFAQLLKTFELAEVQRRIGLWFASTDAFVQRRSWRVEDFFTNFNALKDGAITEVRHGRQGTDGKESTRAFESGEKFAGLTRSVGGSGRDREEGEAESVTSPDVG